MSRSAWKEGQCSGSSIRSCAQTRDTIVSSVQCTTQTLVCCEAPVLRRDGSLQGMRQCPACRFRAERRNLFQEELDLYIGRAPGRLDVMGGIADYSGSLVLQLPLAVACHAAVQLNPDAGVICTANAFQDMLPSRIWPPPHVAVHR